MAVTIQNLASRVLKWSKPILHTRDANFSYIRDFADIKMDCSLRTQTYFLKGIVERDAKQAVEVILNNNILFCLHTQIVKLFYYP